MKFLYTGVVENMAVNVMELLMISLEMELMFLKRTCVEYLIETISLENVLQRYIYGSKYDLHELSQNCFDLIRQEKAGILCSPDWRALVKDNVDIMFQLILKLI